MKLSKTRHVWQVARQRGLAELVRIVTFRMVTRHLAILLRRVAATTLRQKLNADRRPVLIMTSNLDWSYPFQHRVHHLARALASKGFLIVYISACRGHDRILTVSEIYPGVLVTPHLQPSLRAIPAPLVYVSSVNVRAVPKVVDGVKQRGGHLLYDYIDHLEETVSDARLSSEFMKAHDHILGDSRLAWVLASAEVLCAEVGRVRKINYALVENAADIEHFRRTKDPLRLGPKMAQIVERGMPVIGFFGALASWIDTDLIIEVSRLRPSYQFVLIGPTFASAPARMTGLPKNIHLLGAVPYDELPSQAVFCDVFMIPFRRNEITAATSPLKLFEYAAIGRPIVSTPIQEVLKHDVVLKASTPVEFAAALDRALRLGQDREYCARLRELAIKSSWSARADRIVELIAGTK